jgi:hypothetical protein
MVIQFRKHGTDVKTSYHVKLHGGHAKAVLDAGHQNSFQTECVASRIIAQCCATFPHSRHTKYCRRVMAAHQPHFAYCRGGGGDDLWH